MGKPFSLIPIVKAAIITINPNLPGPQTSTAGPAGWVYNFYQFALLAAGVLAFAVVVYGGFKYATSAGDASRQSDGRALILNALLGILLLAAAYIILNVINPNLTKLQNPTVSALPVNSGQ